MPEPQRRKPPPPKDRRTPPKGYAALSTRPLHVLVFLLPLVIAYEIGSIVYLVNPEGDTKQILAQKILHQFFELFGVGGDLVEGRDFLF